MNQFPLWPENASTTAGDVDMLYIFVIAVTVFFSLLIAALIVFLAIRYRERDPNAPAPKPLHGDIRLEMLWIVIPLIISLAMFVWGTQVYLNIMDAPKDAHEIYTVGKQWMWKIQHPTGQREINELHVPTGQAFKLIMTSEDVVHSFYVPAFRMKKDVVPGMYTTTWFEATKPGEYHLFCAEYCGTSHSQMIGRVVVMQPADFQNWLSGNTANLSLAESGEKLFNRLGCQTCHAAGDNQRGPSLSGLFGSEVQLRDGKIVIADEGYIRESIRNPDAKLVEGYEPVMPTTFANQVSEEEMVQLIAYIKTLSAGEAKK